VCVCDHEGAKGVIESFDGHVRFGHNGLDGHNALKNCAVCMYLYTAKIKNDKTYEMRL
jgi:hypothetical protein